MYGGHLRKATNKIEKNRRDKRKGKLPTRLADFVVDIKGKKEKDVKSILIAVHENMNTCVSGNAASECC